jgi:hypothetical protein
LHEFCIKYCKLTFQEIEQYRRRFYKKIEMANFEKLHLQDKNLNAEKDSRKHPRRSCKKTLIFAHKYRHFKGIVTDISRGGAFVETGNKISLGARINLDIRGNKNRRGVRLRGWIVRSGPEGVGVSFDRRSDRERRFDLDRRIGLDRRKAEKS